MSLARNVLTVGTATLLSRVLGFVRDVMIAALIGAGALADAFFVAFQLPNLARRLLAEGALNAALVPMYLRARDEGGDAAAGAFAGRITGTLTLLLLLAAGVFLVAMPAVVLLLAPGFGAADPRMVPAIAFARLTLPYMVLAGALSVLMGVLNANQRFAAAGFAAVVFNAVLVAALATMLLGRVGDVAAGRALSVAIGFAGLAQLALLGAAVWIAPERATPVSVSVGPEMRRFLALAIPGLIAGGIPQLTVIAGVMVASVEPSAVSWLYYANRLIELPLGIVGIAVGTVLMPAFSHALRAGDKAKLIETESRGLELTLGLALPAAIALAVLAEPIVRTLFERGAFLPADTAATALALAAFALGLPGHVLVKAFAPVFFAREDTATPMRAALAGFVVAVVGSLSLFPLIGHAGVAVAIALSGWAGAGLLGVMIAARIGFSLDAAARRRLPRIALAALAMGIAVQLAARLAGPWLAAGVPGVVRAATLGGLVVLGVAAYAVALHLAGVVRLGELPAAVRRRW